MAEPDTSQPKRWKPMAFAIRHVAMQTIMQKISWAILVVGAMGLRAGPHLHFIVRKGLGESGLASRFQMIGRYCYSPNSGDLLQSKHKAW